MGELKVGTIAMVYGLLKNVQNNGKCVTLVEIQDPSTGSVRVGLESLMLDLNEDMKNYLSDSKYWWLCDDGCLYMPKNLLPIGDKDTDLVKNKEKENEH